MKFVALSLFLISSAASAYTRLTTVSCVKAYSDRETAQKKTQCEASAKALDASSDASLSFRSECISGRDAFYVHGCGIYDVAWTLEIRTTHSTGESTFTRCLKAYSNAETAQVLPRCETAAAALRGISSPQVSFDPSCVTGRDVFFKLGCGVYDVALTGRLNLNE